VAHASLKGENNLVSKVLTTCLTTCKNRWNHSKVNIWKL